MGVTTIVAACIYGVLTNISPAQEQGWRGIVPLHSTREDVERLVGPPMSLGGITYDLKTERLNVVYSAGDCRDARVEWNVPRDTVLGMTIYPQTRVMLSDLKTDLSKFTKFINPHVGDRVSYSNKEEGTAVGATLNGEVISFQYFPRAKDGHLRCPGFSTRPLGTDELPCFKFDEYSNLSRSDERARLDNFAGRLTRESELQGYILAYATGKARSREALARAKRARAYLMKRWRIEASRLEARFAGSREKATFQLCLVPKSVQTSSSKF